MRASSLMLFLFLFSYFNKVYESFRVRLQEYTLQVEEIEKHFASQSEHHDRRDFPKGFFFSRCSLSALFFEFGVCV
jgi:hypothetical protein